LEALDGKRLRDPDKYTLGRNRVLKIQILKFSEIEKRYQLGF